MPAPLPCWVGTALLCEKLRNLLMEVSYLPAAIWALKSIFYDLDQENVGFVRMKDILCALWSASWPRVPVVSANAASDGETKGKGEARMPIELLRGIGAGLAEGGDDGGGGDGGGGEDGVEDGRASLVNYIQHLLSPTVSLRTRVALQPIV